MRSTGSNAGNRVRLVKGSHIIMRKFWEGEQAYLLQNTDKRVIFVNPYEGDLCLIGTTDIPFDGAASEVKIAPDEVDYLLTWSIAISKSIASPPNGISVIRSGIDHPDRD